MRKEVGRQWGSDLAYPNREAVIYHNLETEIYEVEYYDKGKLIETREMITESEDGNRTVHSLRYAEDAAENYCLGYMQVGDGKEKIPEVPEVPDVPLVPEVPDVPDVPEVPDGVP